MSDTSAAPVCVFGAGAVGCYLGGRLAAAGTPVALVGRARIGDAIRANGLTVTDSRGYRATLEPAQVAFSTDPAAAAAARLVLVTAKSAATHDAVAQLTGVLWPGTVVVSFQNGLSNADVLRKALPQATVLAGMVPFNVIERAPGAFHQGSTGALAADASPALRPFTGAFARAGLPLALHRDMRAVQWAKLLLNLNNAVNALANLPLRDEFSQRAYRRCVALAQREALHVLVRAAHAITGRMDSLGAGAPRSRVSRAGRPDARDRSARAFVDVRRSRRTPHAARRTPHAARRTPRAVRPKSNGSMARSSGWPRASACRRRSTRGFVHSFTTRKRRHRCRPGAATRCGPNWLPRRLARVACERRSAARRAPYHARCATAKMRDASHDQTRTRSNRHGGSPDSRRL
nr:2-dehydropantoate 2-reductase [Burkholderia ambifaria]